MGLTVNSVDVTDVKYGGAVGYNVIGSPTISAGVVSGISSGNLLQVAQQVAPQNITERVVKLKFNASAIGSGRYHNVFYGPASLSLVFYAAADADKINSVSCYLPGVGSSLFYGLAALVADTWYWFKYTYEGTTASLYKSTDGSNYTLLHSLPATISGSVGNCSIGNRWNGDASFFDGEIDMNETYFKVNGKLWFWQPRDVEKVYYNGTLVWQRPIPFVQQWSDDQPSQHNTPIPLDTAGLKTGISSVVEESVFEFSGVQTDTAGLETGLISVVEEDATL